MVTNKEHIGRCLERVSLTTILPSSHCLAHFLIKLWRCSLQGPFFHKGTDRIQNGIKPVVQQCGLSALTGVTNCQNMNNSQGLRLCSAVNTVAQRSRACAQSPATETHTGFLATHKATDVAGSGNGHGVWKEILCCNLKGDTESQVLQPFVTAARNPHLPEAEIPGSQGKDEQQDLNSDKVSVGNLSETSRELSPPFHSHARKQLTEAQW